MINQTSEESITTASPSAEKETRQPSRSQKLSGKSFDFLWKRDSRRENGSKREENQWKREDLIEVKIVECKLNPPTKNASTSKMSFDFFRNIKKHMQIRSIMMCKSKQKAKEICTSGPQNVTNQESLSLYNDRPICIQENNLVESRSNNSRASDVSCNDESSNLAETPSHSKHTSRLVNEILQRCSDIERNNEVVCEEFSGKTEVSHNNESIYNEHRSCSSNERQEVQYNVAIGNTLMEQKADSVEKIVAQTENGEATFNENRIKTSLTEELLKLSKYGWYWGPISGNEADAKLISEPDGAFLVRDSSDDRYVLTLSFKSSGKLLHARMEHSGGLFSLCNQCESEGFTSVAALINHSMNFSQPFCYSRPKYPGYPSFPVRLTKPVSRFTQVRSLQYLCRFVIRQNTRLDNIHKLPLPKTIKGYIEEAHY